MEVFDQIRTAVLADCAQFFKDLGVPFYGANKPGTKISPGLRGFYLAPGNAARTQRRLRDCIKAFSETEFTEDLKKFALQPSFCAATTTDRADRCIGLVSSKIVKGRRSLRALFASRLPGRLNQPAPAV